ANIAAGRGSTFRYFGTGSGTSPLPISLAYFSAVPTAQAGDASKYTSTLFANTTYVNALALNQPAPGTFVSNLSTGSAAQRANVRLAGMTRSELQKAVGMRFNDGAKLAYFLPQDIVDNTIRAFNTSATAANGYGSLGAPSGRYVAPASSGSCIEVYAGQCGGT